MGSNKKWIPFVGTQELSVGTVDRCVTNILKQNTHLNNLNFYYHHLMTKSQVYSLDELNSKVYNIFILDNCEKPTLQGILRLSLNRQM